VGGANFKDPAQVKIVTLDDACKQQQVGEGHFPNLDAYEIDRNHDAMPEGLAPMPTSSGACFSARLDDFKALGGFDEGYFLHVEDVDLCWRVRRQGGVVLFHPLVTVKGLPAALPMLRARVLPAGQDQDVRICNHYIFDSATGK
jgi:hypothetical protein